MGYGSKSSDIKDTAYLSHGVHEVYLIDIYAGIKKRAKGEETDDVCDIMFKGIQGEFKIRAFNPDNDEDLERKEKNQKYNSDLFAYIGKRITGKEVEIPSTINSWKELTDFFIKLMGPKEGYSKIPLLIKLVGNDYNGKQNIVVTRYFGWLEKKGGKVPTFSPAEIAANNKYDAAVNKKTPKSEEEEGSEEGAIVF